jgi:hypothetical protein
MIRLRADPGGGAEWDRVDIVDAESAEAGTLK